MCAESPASLHPHFREKKHFFYICEDRKMAVKEGFLEKLLDGRG